tara:strand:- start:97 stop:849 length:753 start_codon:yes stop_codon:yes gene_type:complete
MSNYSLEKSKINEMVYLEFIGDNFFIDNFSNQSNHVEIKCVNKINNKIIKNLPLRASWTHQSKKKRLVTNDDGIATFQLCSLWTNKKNQVLRISVDTDYPLFNKNSQTDSINYFIETNVKTNSPKIYLDASIKNFGIVFNNEEIIKELKKYFSDEFFVDFTKNKNKSDFTLILIVDTFEKKSRTNPNLPYIIHTISSLSLNMNNTKEKIFYIDLPEIKAGDYDKKNKAGKKAINDLTNYIKNNKLLEAKI